MRKPGPVMVSLRLQENLRLVLQAPERPRMQNTVTVPLIAGAHLAGFYLDLPAPGLIREGCIGAQDLMFTLLDLLTDGHGLSFPAPENVPNNRSE